MLPSNISVAFAARPAITPGTREIAGLVLPWNATAYSRGHHWSFRPGSVHWPDPVSRVKLNRDHKPDQPVGVALGFENRADGLYGRFRVARTAEGDEVLASAEDGVRDGFSIEVGFGDGDRTETRDDGVIIVHRGGLMGVASTGSPAYEGARVESVAAARDTSSVRLPDVYADPPLAAAVRATQEREGASYADLARRGLRAVTTPRPTYGSGSSYSLVRDAVAVVRDGHLAVDARQRLTTFAATTANTSSVVEPSYRPLALFDDADRPLLALCEREPIERPTPITMPGQITASGVASHVEGVAPSAGTLTLAGGIATPRSISGVFDISRELADTASPAIDAVVLAALRESYAQQTEAAVAAELVAVTAGTITNGVVPSGAQVATTAAGTVDVDLRKMLARMVKARRRRPHAAVATADEAFAEQLATQLDEATGGSSGLWRVEGAFINLSADLTSSSGATAAVATTPASVWAWESPTKTFEWAQVEGPGLVRLALHGYFAVKTLRPSGVAALRVS